MELRSGRVLHRGYGGWYERGSDSSNGCNLLDERGVGGPGRTRVVQQGAYMMLRSGRLVQTLPCHIRSGWVRRSKGCRLGSGSFVPSPFVGLESLMWETAAPAIEEDLILCGIVSGFDSEDSVSPVGEDEICFSFPTVSPQFGSMAEGCGVGEMVVPLPFAAPVCLVAGGFVQRQKPSTVPFLKYHSGRASCKSLEKRGRCSEREMQFLPPPVDFPAA